MCKSCLQETRDLPESHPPGSFHRGTQREQGCAHLQRVVAQLHRQRAAAVAQAIGPAVVDEGGGGAGVERGVIFCMREEVRELLGMPPPDITPGGPQDDAQGGSRAGWGSALRLFLRQEFCIPALSASPRGNDHNPVRFPVRALKSPRLPRSQRVTVDETDGRAGTSSALPFLHPGRAKHQRCDFSTLRTPTAATEIWTPSSASHIKEQAPCPQKAPEKHRGCFWGCRGDFSRVLGLCCALGGVLCARQASPLLVLTASRRLAQGGGHPEVGGAGVEEHQEALRGGPDADLPVVGHLEERGHSSHPILSQRTAPRGAFAKSQPRWHYGTGVSSTAPWGWRVCQGQCSAP